MQPDIQSWFGSNYEAAMKRVNNEVWEQVEGRDNLVVNQVPWEAQYQIWDQVYDPVYNQVSVQVNGQVWIQVWDQVWIQVRQDANNPG